MEKEKKGSFRLSIVILAIGILLIIVGGILAISNKKSDGSANVENTNNNTNSENTEIDTKDDTIKYTLLAYLPAVSNLGDNNYSVYQSNAVTPNDIDPSVLIASISSSLRQILECSEEHSKANGTCDFLLEVGELRSYAKQRYGIDNIELVNSFDGSIMHCTLVKDKYACSINSEELEGYNYSDYFGIVVDKSFTVNVKKVLKVEQKDDYAYLYEKYVNCRFDYIQNSGENYNNINNYKFKIYKYDNTDELLVKDYLEGKDFYNLEKPFRDNVFDYIKENYTTYKHTFKKNEDGSYSWTKSEPLK